MHARATSGNSLSLAAPASGRDEPHVWPGDTQTCCATRQELSLQMTGSILDRFRAYLGHRNIQNTTRYKRHMRRIGSRGSLGIKDAPFGTSADQCLHFLA